MAVKRRVIWMTDDEWAILTKYAADNGETISGVIRGFWRLAAERPIGPSFNSKPFRPVPKR